MNHGDLVKVRSHRLWVCLRVSKKTTAHEHGGARAGIYSAAIGARPRLAVH